MQNQATMNRAALSFLGTPHISRRRLWWGVQLYKKRVIRTCVRMYSLERSIRAIDLREGGALVATRAGTDSAYPVEPVPERIDAESLAWLGPAYWYNGSTSAFFGMACGSHGSCAFIGGTALAH